MLLQQCVFQGKVLPPGRSGAGSYKLKPLHTQQPAQEEEMGLFVHAAPPQSSNQSEVKLCCCTFRSLPFLPDVRKKKTLPLC